MVKEYSSSFNSLGSSVFESFGELDNPHAIQPTTNTPILQIVEFSVNHLNAASGNFDAPQANMLITTIIPRTLNPIPPSEEGSIRFQNINRICFMLMSLRHHPISAYCKSEEIL